MYDFILIDVNWLAISTSRWDSKYAKNNVPAHIIVYDELDFFFFLNYLKLVIFAVEKPIVGELGTNRFYNIHIDEPTTHPLDDNY